MIHQVFPDLYQAQLDAKVERIQQLFAEFGVSEIETFDSPKEHYRLRAEFKIWHETDKGAEDSDSSNKNSSCNYAMFQPGERKKSFTLDSFPVGSLLINQLMPPLMLAINASELLSRRLFSVEFLTTLSGDALITMLYHKPLCEEWQAEAEELQKQLGYPIIGRARKSKVVLDRDYVMEELNVANKTYRYQQIETGFTQPNGSVNQKMLSWALSACQGIKGDLLELYCGNGNFTCVFADHFDKVLATEIAKLSVRSAQHNFEINNIDNVSIARMSSEEFSQAMDKVRSFKRLKDIDLDSYNFSTIFVDPPRSGLDEHTTDVVKRFDNIIYVSCNPETLHHNLQSITETHSIERFAVFDQFPYTDHLECGVLLKAKS